MKTNIEIHIDELVLHGFSPHDRYRVGLALESELTRLFRENSLTSSLSGDVDIPFLNAGQFITHPSANTGRQIAKAVYSSMNTSGPRSK